MRFVGILQDAARTKAPQGSSMMLRRRRSCMAEWRLARPEEDDAIVAMSLALYDGESRMAVEQVRVTLVDLPGATHAAGRSCSTWMANHRGYALPVSFWVQRARRRDCTIDEL